MCSGDQLFIRCIFHTYLFLLCVLSLMLTFEEQKLLSLISFFLISKIVAHLVDQNIWMSLSTVTYISLLLWLLDWFFRCQLECIRCCMWTSTTFPLLPWVQTLPLTDAMFKGDNRIGFSDFTFDPSSLFFWFPERKLFHYGVCSGAALLTLKETNILA